MKTIYRYVENKYNKLKKVSLQFDISRLFQIMQEITKSSHNHFIVQSSILNQLLWF